MRADVPWLTSAPSEIVRDHVRLTVQPIDAADEAEGLLRLIDHLGSDELFLFSTDYPHWQFDGDDALPAELSDTLIRKIVRENPIATYPRLAKAARLVETTT